MTTAKENKIELIQNTKNQNLKLTLIIKVKEVVKFALKLL